MPLLASGKKALPNAPAQKEEITQQKKGEKGKRGEAVRNFRQKGEGEKKKRFEKKRRGECQSKKWGGIT